MIQSINPKNYDVIAQYQEITEPHIVDIIEFVNHAYLDWRKTSFEHRLELTKKLADELRKGAHLFAQIITDEMGKVLPESKSEIMKCAEVCDFYAENGEDFLKNELIPSSATKSYVSYQPIGVILAVMPWNFPFWQVIRFAVPTLLAGNTCLLKHAPNVTQSAMEIEDLFHKAGFPENTFRTLIVNQEKVEFILEHPMVKAVSLTGSTRAGSAVASKAGEQIKKAVLELGGNDPYIILKDADLDETVKKCIQSRLINSGQSCIAAKRFIVEEPIYDQFAAQLTDAMKSITFGDPLTHVDIGPLARKDLRDDLHDQVVKSIEKGAICTTGGFIPDINGAYYPPTVIKDVQKGMPAYEEELFGPVASIIKAKNEMDAIGLANDSIYGLGAAVFTKNIERGLQIAENELEAGCCFVNDFVRSDPRLPFGGIKQSGYGRELGLFGIREFVNVKTIYRA